MAYGLFNELSKTGENLRRSIISPIESKLQAEEIKEQKRLMAKKESEYDEKKGHRKAAADHLPGMFKGEKGEFAKDAYLSGEPLQSIAMSLRERSGRGRGGGKPRKPTIFEDLNEVTAVNEQINANVTNAAEKYAEDPGNLANAKAYQAALDQKKYVNRMLVGMDKDLQSSAVMSLAKENVDFSESMSPQNIAATGELLNTLLQEHYGVGQDVMGAMKEAQEVFGVELPTLEHIPTWEDLSRATIAAQGAKWGSKRNISEKYDLGAVDDTKSIAQDEIREILNIKDPAKLQEIANDPEVPIAGRVMAATFLKHVALAGLINEKVKEKIKSASEEELEEFTTKKPKTRTLKKEVKRAQRRKRRKKYEDSRKSIPPTHPLGF